MLTAGSEVSLNPSTSLPQPDDSRFGISMPSNKEIANHSDALQRGTHQVEQSAAEHWVVPVGTIDDESADEVIRTLIEQDRTYAFGEKSTGKKLKRGDWICFYSTEARGIVAHAKIASPPNRGKLEHVHRPDRFPWVVKLTQVSIYLSNPVALDSDLRRKLDAFQPWDAGKVWSWCVQQPHRVTAHDFNFITRDFHPPIIT